MFEAILERLTEKLRKKRLRRLRRNLRKGRLNSAYAICNEITQFGRVLHTLGARRNDLGQAKVFGCTDKIYSKDVPNRPPLTIQVALIDNPIVVSRTDGFIADKKLYHPDFLKHIEHRHDVKNRTFKLDMHSKPYVARLPKGMKVTKKISGLVVSLVKEHSHNYYHFIFEILPKLIHLSEVAIGDLIAKDGEHQPITILLDSGVPSQCLEYIQKAVGYSYELEMLESFEMASCEQLLYCTPFFHALDNTRVQNFDVDDFYVDRYAVSLVQRFCRPLLTNKVKPERMLYLDRSPDQLRQIVNGSEVERLLVEYGFEVVFPEAYPLDEQIQLFRHAKCIIGGSGAAFTNIIHMQANTYAIMFTPDLPLTNYFFFQQQADAAKVSLIHINTVNEQKVKTLHDDASVDVTVLNALLESIFEKKHKGNFTSSNAASLKLS